MFCSPLLAFGRSVSLCVKCSDSGAVLSLPLPFPAFPRRLFALKTQKKRERGERQGRNPEGSSASRRSCGGEEAAQGGSHQCQAHLSFGVRGTWRGSCRWEKLLGSRGDLQEQTLSSAPSPWGYFCLLLIFSSAVCSR